MTLPSPIFFPFRTDEKTLTAIAANIRQTL